MEVAASKGSSDRAGSGRRLSLPGRLSRSNSLDATGRAAGVGAGGGVFGLLPYPPHSPGVAGTGGGLGSPTVSVVGGGVGGVGLSSPVAGASSGGGGGGFSLLPDGMNGRSPSNSLHRSNSGREGGSGTGSMRSLNAALAAAADEASWGCDPESSKGRPKLNLAKRTVAAPVGGRAEGSNPYVDASPRRQSSNNANGPGDV